ncbi:MAG: hypothetical protein V1854_03705 [Methanobacteriota archaeon]
MGNEKIIYIVLICGVLGVSLGFVIPAVISERIMPEMEPEQPVVRPEPAPLLLSDLTLLIQTRGNICEECHLSGKVTSPQADRIKKHTDGGVYCLKCHTISHEKHPVEGNVTCQDCHGSANPKIPSPDDASPLCNNCHAYPDALLPGYGDLVSIHQPRGINCVSCHLDCMKCHNVALAGKKWDKRLNHFNTLPDTYK